MFNNIDIKRLGEYKTDPFQIQITVRGVKNNIIDVGYGVSQILPILVTIFQSKKELGYFGIQNPEVHLHPKAQAALSSLFASIAKENEKNFIIETHSDYMIDRARIDIMQGKISPDNVSIAYFDPQKDGTVKIYNIGIDKEGNLVGEPESYKEFFLQEGKNLMGF